MDPSPNLELFKCIMFNISIIYDLDPGVHFPWGSISHGTPKSPDQVLFKWTSDVDKQRNYRILNIKTCVNFLSLIFSREGGP